MNPTLTFPHGAIIIKAQRRLSVFGGQPLRVIEVIAELVRVPAVTSFLQSGKPDLSAQQGKFQSE
jgi:hypothetical protein